MSPALRPLLLAALAGLAGVAAAASFPAPPHRNEPLPDHASYVSAHVWAITSFPNIAIVVGRDATLVVDTGLGAVNGATAAWVAKRLAPHSRLYLTTTHFHPEHVAGVMGFPPGTILIRSAVQQREIDAHGEAMVRLFADQTAQWHGWLRGEQLRAPDEVFDRERRLDLGGGVVARLLSVGPAHTLGDQLVFVDPDRTLVSGDIVQNKVGPYIYGKGGTPDSWIRAVDQAAALKPLHVVPDHSPVGDGKLVAQERAFLIAVRTRAETLRGQGLPAAQAGERLTAEFKTKYPGWTVDDLTGFVSGLWRAPAATKQGH